MMDVVERAQLAIAQAFGDDLENHMLRSRRITAARAAIAAVLDAMAEPSEEIIEAGFRAREYGQTMAEGANAVWQAMLSAMRAEMGV